MRLRGRWLLLRRFDGSVDGGGGVWELCCVFDCIYAVGDGRIVCLVQYMGIGLFV
jgi:hypothetical protein